MITRLICICCLMLAVFSAALAQASGPTVELSLIVTDRQDKSIRELRKDEAVYVFEDKVQQTLLSVDVDQRPVDLVIAVDGSGSFRKLLAPALEMVSSIIATRRPDDQIFLERFIDTDKIQKVQGFTGDKKVLIEALRKMDLIEGGRTAIIDALYTAVNYVAEHNKDVPGRRKAVLIVTDGEDRNSYYKAEKLINLLREQRVQVFVLGFTSELDDLKRARAEDLLNSVARESGGRVFFLREAKELIDLTVQIAADLTRQFRVTYQSSNPEPLKKTFRTIEVKVDSEEKRKAIARSGYYVQPSEKKSP